ncbi:MAG: Gx transporter family protein [Desulfuromonadales bacterium]|nr:Gx transporter family protein [Desulfuromonadales bacterium]
MTSSPVDPLRLERTRRYIFLALLATLATAIHTVEYLFPTPAPWFRFGFANIFSVLALYLFDFRAAFTVTLTRIGFASLLLGRIFSPGFFLSLGGGLAAVALMSLACHLGKRYFSPIGVSVIGAVGHVFGQMLLAWLLLVQHPGLWSLFPFFLFFALVAGLINGFAADFLLQTIRRHPSFAEAPTNRPTESL